MNENQNREKNQFPEQDPEPEAQKENNVIDIKTRGDYREVQDNAAKREKIEQLKQFIAQASSELDELARHANMLKLQLGDLHKVFKQQVVANAEVLKYTRQISLLESLAKQSEVNLSPRLSRLKPIYDKFSKRVARTRDLKQQTEALKSEKKKYFDEHRTEEKVLPSGEKIRQTIDIRAMIAEIEKFRQQIREQELLVREKSAQKAEWERVLKKLESER